MPTSNEAITKANLQAFTDQIKIEINSIRSDLHAVEFEPKADVEMVRSDVNSLRAEVKADIATLRVEFKSDLQAAVDSLEAKLATKAEELNPYVDERTRDLRTELLRGFRNCQGGVLIRFSKLSADTSNIGVPTVSPRFNFSLIK